MRETGRTIVAEMALRPVPVPSSREPVLAWEQLRALYVAEEMEARKASPATVAAAADVRFEAAARGVVGEALPLKVQAQLAARSAGDHPGRLHPDDQRSWLIVSRPEDGRSQFLPDDRIKHRTLADLATSYDPALHRAPVVIPQGGPAHFTGEFGPPVGQVEALEFDGYFLWALVADPQGKLARSVADGYDTRSIRWWESFPAAEGKPYLRHLAVTAEPAGTPGLGNLDQFLSRSDADVRSEWASLKTHCRTLPDLPTERSDTMADPKETATQPGDKGGQERTEPQARWFEPLAKDETFLRTLAQGLAGPLKELLKPQAEQTPTAPDPEAIRTAVDAAVKAAVKPIQEEAETSRREAKRTRIDAALDELQREGRIIPAQRTDLAEDLLNLADDKLAGRLEKMRGYPAIYAGLRNTIQHVEEDGKVLGIGQAFRSPEGDMPDPAFLRSLAEKARAADKEAN